MSRLLLFKKKPDKAFVAMHSLRARLRECRFVLGAFPVYASASFAFKIPIDLSIECFAAAIEPCHRTAFLPFAPDGSITLCHYVSYSAIRGFCSPRCRTVRR